MAIFSCVTLCDWLKDACVRRILVNRELKQPRRRRQRERQNNNSARASRFFFYISLPSLQDYDVKPPNFTLYGGREHVTTIFFLIWIVVLLFVVALP